MITSTTAAVLRCEGKSGTFLHSSESMREASKLEQPYANPTPTRDVSTLGSRTILAPYHADMDSEHSGLTYYRTYNRFAEGGNYDEEQIQYINQHIQQFHQMNKVFDANFVLIATWENQTSKFLQKGVR